MKPEEHHGHKDVTITVDGNPKMLPKEKYLVGTLKQLVGVPADYELDQVIKGIFTPLNDVTEIHLKDGDIFVSHVRQGGSS